MSRPIRALIHTAALEHNLQQARQYNPDSKIMAVVKANGYGHGIVPVARALSGADGFGVASLEEAMVLRDAGVEHPITALEGFFEETELAYFIEQRVQAVIHSYWQLELLERAKGTGSIDVWVKIDTGMNRLGFAIQDTSTVIARLRECRHVGELGLMSHLACADDTHSDSARTQMERFGTLVQEHQLPASLANSAGVVGWPGNGYQWVRPGIMLYGGTPTIGNSAVALELKPAMTLTSALIAVNQRRKGDAIGYGGDWVCPEDMIVGVVAAGYGDGYPRHARAGTPVLVNNTPAPLIGRVSMDMITVDLRQHKDAKVGDEVVLWGNGLPVDTVADHAGTISYELLCHVTPRVPRIETS
jgi:alanine racemase